MTSKQQLSAQANIAALRAEKEAEKEAAAREKQRHAEFWRGIEQEKQRHAAIEAGERIHREVQESLTRQVEALIDEPETPYPPIQKALDDQDDEIYALYGVLEELAGKLGPVLAGQEGPSAAFLDDTPACPLVHRLRGHNSRLRSIRSTLDNLISNLEC